MKEISNYLMAKWWKWIHFHHFAIKVMRLNPFPSLLWFTKVMGLNLCTSFPAKRFAGNEVHKSISITFVAHKSDRIEFMYFISVKTRFDGNAVHKFNPITFPQFFHIFASRCRILMIFTFLKTALKFVGSSSLLKRMWQLK